MRMKPYTQIAGSIMNAMLCTRPDIAFVVGLVSRFLSNPGSHHWYVVKRTLRYFKGIVNLHLCYQGEVLELRGYSNADWVGDLDQRKSTSGYVCTLGRAAVSWGSKK